MGASRKLQGEIDRVLKKVQEGVDVFDSIWNKVYDTDNANLKEKFEADLKKEIKKLQRYRDQIKTWIQSSEIKDKKVSASYEQALMDARKQIEHEMERFKICEKETKTKAFSKEGLGQQPKADPKEKAKSETRDWLNNVVSELGNQINVFEAEKEGLHVKKGKVKPPRLAHLETSITRHKNHTSKLELILRLLDNDELSPEQVNDVRDFVDDYVERNQEAFDEFGDVDELYHTLPLDKVESLEDLVMVGTPGATKGVSASSLVLNMKPPLATTIQVAVVPDQVDETGFQDTTVAKSPTPRSSNVITSASPTLQVSGITDASTSAVGFASKEEEIASFPSRKASPALSETGLRTSSRVVLPSETASSIIPTLGTAANIASAGAIKVPTEIGKRISGSDDRSFGDSVTPPLVSPLTNKAILSQVSKAGDGLVSSDNGSVSDTSIMGNRVLGSGVSSMQWRPESSFQDQNEGFRGRTEITPDQREKFLQRFHQVQQQTQANLLGMPPLSGVKKFPVQQQTPLQQYNAQSSSISSQLGLGVGVQVSGLTTAAASAPIQLQQTAIPHSSNQNPSVSFVSEDLETGVTKVESFQLQQPLIEDSVMNSCGPSTGLGKISVQDDELKASNALDIVKPAATLGPLADPTQNFRDTELPLGQPLQSPSTSGNLGIIGRRSASDLGAIGDNLSSSSNSGALRGTHYNLQMLEAAYNRLPQPRDSERAKAYVPRRPALTPTIYPQAQAPIIHNPAFWERLGADKFCTDTLFFAFYYQQNTYQQYLAAKELKRNSWRFHRKYNAWFQRHEEPTITTDDFEQGAYVYFDFLISNDEQQGWCQKIMADFTFEYSFLEDDLLT